MNQVSEAIKVLKQGGVVVYPTDTAYGLAVDATNLKAVKKLYRLKGRGFHKPIHVIPSSKQWLIRLVINSAIAENLIKRFWPGPLTLVLPLKAKGKSWQMLSAGTGTIGIRWPKHKIALELAGKLGKPITTTSANVSGKLSCYSVPEVAKQFARSVRKPDYYIDGGKLKKTKPSTVVSLDKGHVTILRLGPVSETQIQRIIRK